MAVEGRLTMCNMAVEFGARTGFVAPDDTTFEYLAGRRYSPRGSDWEMALGHWRSLRSDSNAVFDSVLRLNASGLPPQVTWGTSPEHVMAVDGMVPDPSLIADPTLAKAAKRALEYCQLMPGQRIEGVAIDAAFIGSCTNARLSDLRDAATILRGHHVASGVQAICVPGSSTVKRAAEAEGLDRVFIDAGYQWREAGCSLCISGGTGGEAFKDRARVVSTTNRNFEGRQGVNVRSHLASPATVAASSIVGRVTDVRHFVAH
jgi:3-isopropylmalate/(R)-2-methylmalate dehydratase large subunit